MLDVRIKTLLSVSETLNFTRTAETLNLTQPAVSHHVKTLEEELGVTLFLRKKNELVLTREGEVVIKYAKRLNSICQKMKVEVENCKKNIGNVKIGLTHTQESNKVIETLAKVGALNDGFSITVITDTIKNLYDKLETFEIDLAIVEGKANVPGLYSVMLDTDYLVCVTSNDNPLAKKNSVSLADLKRQRLILRLPTSATRTLFESALKSINDDISNYNVCLEVDNIATIKDLIRKDMGVSVLPRSACADEIKKGKMAALPIDNLSMIRETNIVYHHSFSYPEVVQQIVKTYEK